MNRMLWGLPAALGLAVACAAPAAADEGMWTFDNFPAARMRAAHGWAPDQAWLDKAMAGSVRLENGCSGANVSASGLVLTNHHCVLSCVYDLSSETNYLADGFMARARAAEMRCPGMAVQALQAISDVTSRIDAAANGAAAGLFASARDAEIARIEGECQGDDATKACEVVTLYQGGRYGLYEFKRFEDVRLVFAPEEAAAYFGGDPDNFNFPRYCLDFAFLRLYENGAPAATPARLSMRFTPIEAGEIALVSGNPGATSRLLTTAQLAFERDHFLPWRLDYLSALHGRLIAFSALGEEQARIASDLLLNVENAIKAYRGRRLALMDAAGFARVEAAQADLQARVRRNRAAQRAVGDAWREVAAAQEAYRGFYLPHQLLEERAGGGSELFAWARAIVRGAAERAKPYAERLPHYSEAYIGAAEQAVLAERPVNAAFEELLLSFWLAKVREHLAADDPTMEAVLGGESPEGLAQRLVSGTRLADGAERRRLWQGGAAAVAASNDPLIVWARGWDARARALDARYRDETARAMAPALERIAQARFRAFGDSAYPDTTFSPRLSYGRVEGWTEGDGREVAPFTQLSGLYERATGAAPYKLSQRWIDARARLDGATQFNLVSSNDTVGGNSGSPLLDRDARVIGAVFDGNIHSLGGEYFFDASTNRTVSIAAPIMRAALADVYGMDALLAELEGR